jgi:hypothetical protein
VISYFIKKNGWESYGIGGDYGAFLSSLYVVIIFFRTLIYTTYYKDSSIFYDLYKSHTIGTLNEDEKRGNKLNEEIYLLDIYLYFE